MSLAFPLLAPAHGSADVGAQQQAAEEEEDGSDNGADRMHSRPIVIGRPWISALPLVCL